MGNVVIRNQTAGRTPNGDKEATARPQSADPARVNNPLTLQTKIALTLAYSAIYSASMAAAVALALHIADILR